MEKVKKTRTRRAKDVPMIYVTENGPDEMEPLVPSIWSHYTPSRADSDPVGGLLMCPHTPLIPLVYVGNKPLGTSRYSKADAESIFRQYNSPKDIPPSDAVPDGYMRDLLIWSMGSNNYKIQASLFPNFIRAIEAYFSYDIPYGFSSIRSTTTIEQTIDGFRKPQIITGALRNVSSRFGFLSAIINSGPHVLSVVRSKDYIYHRARMLMGLPVDLSRVIVLVDRRLDLVADDDIHGPFKPLYTKSLEPLLVKSPCKIIKCPLELIVDNCFVPQFKIKSRKKDERQAEMDAILEDFAKNLAPTTIDSSGHSGIFGQRLTTTGYAGYEGLTGVSGFTGNLDTSSWGRVSYQGLNMDTPDPRIRRAAGESSPEPRDYLGEYVRGVDTERAIEQWQQESPVTVVSSSQVEAPLPWVGDQEPSPRMRTYEESVDQLVELATSPQLRSESLLEEIRGYEPTPTSSSPVTEGAMNDEEREALRFARLYFGEEMTQDVGGSSRDPDPTGLSGAHERLSALARGENPYDIISESRLYVDPVISSWNIGVRIPWGYELDPNTGGSTIRRMADPNDRPYSPAVNSSNWRQGDPAPAGYYIDYWTDSDGTYREGLIENDEDYDEEEDSDDDDYESSETIHSENDGWTAWTRDPRNPNMEERFHTDTTREMRMRQ